MPGICRQKRDENFADTRLDPSRIKGRLLIERFNSANLWGWKERRNCLTLPFWQETQPKNKQQFYKISEGLIVVPIRIDKYRQDGQALGRRSKSG